MAMLAEPRRKQKLINLRAKNNAWSNDSTKFGQRMLEKMGWCSGKGLGAHENGIVEHVVAKYKNDDKGLGFEDRNDQWTKHEDDFNSLLANLSNGDTKEEKLHSGVSLEVKSKNSKARVHYHKYTRGKDLTRYSEKDLANIFGKKSLKSKEKAPEVLEPENLKSTEVVFTEKGSMVDYFKSKLALKGKTKVTFSNNCDNDDAGYSFKGFAGTGNEEDETEEQSEVAFQGFSFYPKKSEDNNASEELASNLDEPVKKKSKKNKKSKKDSEEAQDYHENNPENKLNNIPDQDMTEIKSKKNKKSKKYFEETQDNHEYQGPENNDLNACPDQDMTELVKKKKSKKIKHTMDTPEEPPKKKKVKENLIIEEHIDEVIHVPKKKKKRKNKDNKV